MTGTDNFLAELLGTAPAVTTITAGRATWDIDPDRYATAELATVHGTPRADYANGIRLRLHHRHNGVLDTVTIPFADHTPDGGLVYTKPGDVGWRGGDRDRRRVTVADITEGVATTVDTMLNVWGWTP